MKKVTGYFFLLDEGEKLHPSDALWFYGTLVSMAAIGLLVVT